MKYKNYEVGVYEERLRIMSIIAKELEGMRDEGCIDDLSGADRGYIKALVWLNNEIAQKGWEE